MSDKWIDNLNVESIPEKYHQLADTIGIYNLLKLSKGYGGMMVYVPKYDSLTSEIRNNSIKKEFNGGNYKDLALKYNLSESQIRNIIKSDTIDGQISFL